VKKLDYLIEKIEAYSLLAQAGKVFGPYHRRDGRQIVIILDDDGNRRTVSYPKYLMEQHLGRPLDPNMETVDHIDSNFDNNNLDNLRLVPRDIHSGDDTRRVKPISFDCSVCGKKFERSPRLVRDKSKKGKSGPFCSRQCAGRYARRLQLKLLDKLPAQPFIESEYYKRKNVVAVAQYFIQKYGSLIY
jgi:HNH endonuclease/MYM-type Zinc finger with FCS sequence motif